MTFPFKYLFKQERVEVWTGGRGWGWIPYHRFQFFTADVSWG